MCDYITTQLAELIHQAELNGCNQNAVQRKLQEVRSNFRQRRARAAAQDARFMVRQLQQQDRSMGASTKRTAATSSFTGTNKRSRRRSRTKSRKRKRKRSRKKKSRSRSRARSRVTKRQIQKKKLKSMKLPKGVKSVIFDYLYVSPVHRSWSNKRLRPMYEPMPEEYTGYWDHDWGN